MVQKRLDMGACRRPLRPQEGQYLEQRWQLNSSVSKFDKVRMWIVLFSIAFLFSNTFTYTYSLLTDEDTWNENSFRAAHIRDFLKLEPGDAKATFPAGGVPEGEAKPVATYQDEQLMLDFGEVPDDNSRYFKDVLKLYNLRSQSINVSWCIEGPLQNVFAVTSGELTIMPNGTSHSSITSQSVYQTIYSSAECYSPFELNLKFKADCEPGVVDGSLAFKVNGNFLTIRLPARATVRHTFQKAAVPEVKSELEPKVKPEVKPADLVSDQVQSGTTTLEDGQPPSPTQDSQVSPPTDSQDNPPTVDQINSQTDPPSSPQPTKEIESPVQPPPDAQLNDQKPPASNSTPEEAK